MGIVHVKSGQISRISNFGAMLLCNIFCVVDYLALCSTLFVSLCVALHLNIALCVNTV